MSVSLRLTAYAVRNKHGHLSAISEYKAYAQMSRSSREDAKDCQIVEVEVEVKRVIPDPVEGKGKKK